MSFRTRLTSFFVLIVVIPMIAVAFLVFRLISDSEQGKTDARANGVLGVATSLYRSESVAASSDARVIARALSSPTGAGHGSPRSIRATIKTLAGQAGLARVVVRSGNHVLADVGSADAVAPGEATVRGRRLTVTASEITGSQYAGEIVVPGVGVVVRQGPRVLASAGPATGVRALPSSGSVTIDGAGYRVLSRRLAGFGSTPVELTAVASVAATGGSVTSSRVLALAFIVAFLLLALAFSVLASRGLQGQVSRFLQAARRLAGGDFSSPVPIEGRDEFAALGQEFNNMSSQLEQRLDELSQERARLREAIRRIGETFESNLDRPALLDLALKTAIDSVRGSGGRISVRPAHDQPLAETIRHGSLEPVDPMLEEAERTVLEAGDVGEGEANGNHVIAVPMGTPESGGYVHGLITVVRPGEPFSADDRELLRSLAAQATLALENVDLHVQVSRQAVTDELTGLANHGRFQDLLGAEIEGVRRYHHALGLIMVDIDNFKSVNDTYGHQQGDVVLRRVARVLADSSREVDYPARYGGEELAVILPHTDIEGAYAIAERIRTSIEALRIPRMDNQGMLQVTASLGVASSTEGEKNALIAEADAALYEAKRRGKNRTVTAPIQAANLVSGE
ncbi:MAG TPA: diguanylate cyclase [Solirubrobacteraceae bacterium]|nr:diguanylate cyclase [Solirubrobacteraceae bacterium]